MMDNDKTASSLRRFRDNPVSGMDRASAACGITPQVEQEA
jgi:hypothetical protein